ncbi:2-dehydro-3-deoxygalactonokinase [Bacillus sp. REN16]|uniref:2-dehydro-3-deoxygalactonokinase n=1 Tax=Bacillus sp. REN16 TaxID=2887296 RepID=UPI001E3EA2D2|nr:2-dehydro-3-deoxygalactonokinase [Bacillus sp. REN16]MCC3358986.1 2-dehydro-3-deoxygalactonokinase [Bacillus sp. REN16]
MYRITIDTGTTNSRVTLWEDEMAIAKAFCEVGVRNTAIDGHNQQLQNSVKELIEDVLNQKKLTVKDIATIIGSGMITSNVGLVEVPHLLAPAGVEELASGMVPKMLPNIVDKEIWFIPGIKNNVPVVSVDNCEQMDIMRGEEVETIGLIERLRVEGPAVFVLPGSHSKFVSLNEENKMTGCLTSIAGELLSVITHNTIIADAVNKSFATDFQKELVLKGFENGTRVGVTRTAFSVRILSQFTYLTDNEKANFLLGVVLSGDIKAIKNSESLNVSQDTKVIIAGKDSMKDSFEAIVKEDGYFSEIKAVSSEDQRDLAGFGSICIAKRRGL